MRSKDEIAHERYGVTYKSLSSWGRADVDRVAWRSQEPSFSAVLPSATEEVSLRQANIKLTEELEAASQENLDLWEQLNETREELEELRSKFNPPLQ